MSPPEPPPIIPAKAALLLIDFQRDFCSKGGYADLCFGNVDWLGNTIERAQVLLAVARRHSLTVIHTREGYAPDLSDVDDYRLRGDDDCKIGSKGPLGRLLIRGEYGQDIIDELKPLEEEIVLDKHSYGAFATTNLLEILRRRGIQQLIFSGVTADVCVHTTLREARDRGFECWYCKDAISTPNETIRRACELMIEHEGNIWGWLVDVNQVLQSLSETK